MARSRAKVSEEVEDAAPAGFWVRAVRDGISAGNTRRRKGTVFFLANPKHFKEFQDNDAQGSARTGLRVSGWMERVDGPDGSKE